MPVYNHTGIVVFIRDPDRQFLELLSKEYPNSRPPRSSLSTASGTS
jgi:hypothetical protein